LPAPNAQIIASALGRRFENIAPDILAGPLVSAVAAFAPYTAAECKTRSDSYSARTGREMWKGAAMLRHSTL
jgi:hypothetical protein